MCSGYFKWQIPNLRGRAEIPKQLVSSVKKFNLLLLMVLGKKVKCLAKQLPSPQPAGMKGKLVEQSGFRELQSGPWHLQAAKLLRFPSCCPSPCSLPTYTHSCSLPRQPWCPPVSKNVRNAAPWCWASAVPATGTRAVYKIPLQIFPGATENRIGRQQRQQKEIFLPFLWTIGKVGGYC